MEAAEFNRIAGKYTDVVYRATLSYCKNKNDAEDAVQNTFLNLLKTDTQFADDEHIRKWLIRSAINECKNIWKSFWHRNVTSIDELNEEPAYIESEKQELFSEVMKLPKSTARYCICITTKAIHARKLRIFLIFRKAAYNLD